MSIKAISKAMIIVLLIAIIAMLLFDVTARTNVAGRNLLQQYALVEENAYVSLLYVSGDSGKISVDPRDNVYYSWEKRMNDTIVINVTVSNMTGLCGLSFNLYFNSSLLTCTGFIENLFHTVAPQSAWSNIWQIKRTINNVAGYIEYVYTYMDLPQALHGGYEPINITESDYPEGKLPAAILTFSITKMPSPNAYLDCPLHLTFVQPTDAQGNVILYDVVDGYYRLMSPTGDINGDSVIDIYDAILFSDAFGSVPVSPYWNPKADLNSDDIVDIFDAIVLATSFGKPTP